MIRKTSIMFKDDICFVIGLLCLTTLCWIAPVDSEESDISSIVTLESKSPQSHEHHGGDHHDQLMNHEHSQSLEDTNKTNESVYKIIMSNVTTKEDDIYMCIDWSPSFSGKHFIVGFEVIPDNPNVHHMILYACSGSPQRIGNARLCDGDCQPGLIYFAWARNAQSTNLPKDVGFVIGSNGIDYLQLQVHYRTSVAIPDQSEVLLSITSDPMPNSAGVLLMITNNIVIPAHTKKIVGNISCLYNDDTELHPFAFRTHTHMLGQVLSGYVVHGSTWTKIGKGNPKWPQAFWPVSNNDVVIRKGDHLVAKCVYSSEDYNVDVHIGATQYDEMCNFYVMYYKKFEDANPMNACMGDQFPELSKNAPLEATELLPPNPELEILGEGTMSSHHHHDSSTINSDEKLSLQPVDNWPNLSSVFNFGQISGISTDNSFVYVLHRGKILWDNESFDYNHSYKKKDQGPIKEKVLVQLNSTTGVLINSWADNFFYMPHGVHASNDGIIWITDVAMHQVFKFKLSELQSGEILNPLVTIGTKFIPGSDSYHLCKPADVVTNLTGHVFIADGYCNSRVMAFDSLGSFVKSWELDNGPGLPHSISIDDTKGIIYVADRVNARIISYDSSGKFMKEIKHDNFKPELFAISYAKDKLFCVNGQLSFGESHEMKTYHVMIVDPSQGKMLSQWNLPPLHDPHSSPHDVSISPDADFVVIAIVGNPGKILKFDSGSSKNYGLEPKTTKKLGITYHRRPIGKILADDHRNSLDGIEDRKYKLTLIFIVVLCLFVLPLSVIVGIAIYLKSRHKNVNGYSHLEAAQQVNRRYNGKSTGEVVKTFVSGRGSIPQDSIREEELKRLESESEEEFSVENLKPDQI